MRIPNKPVNKEEQEAQPKRIVTGTNADLRKLPLKDARDILRKNGVPETEIKRLSRWEVIDVVRTLSTEKVKSGEDVDQRFVRGNRFSIAEHQERYREDCQRIFDVQNRVLASAEVLSSDEAESSEDDDDKDEDLYEMGKSLESLLSNKKSSSQIMREREEKERKKLHSMIHSSKTDATPAGSKKDEAKDKDKEEDDGPPKVLRITRTIRDPNGKVYTLSEVVRKPLVIETYLRVRQTKSEDFIKQFATPDEAAKEEMKKEKRRIQEQLRRIKRNQEKERIKKAEQEAKMAAKAAKLAAKGKSLPDASKVKCGACGQAGHMKTNTACPKYDPNDPDILASMPVGNVGLTEKEEEELEKGLIDAAEGEELIKVDGTKVTLNSKIVKHAEEVRRRSMILKVPKQTLKASKRRRVGAVEHCDYLTNKNYKNVKRRRTDPVVTLASFLEAVLSDLRVMDEALQFLQPVNTKKVVDYLDKVKIPMDLQTVKDNILKKKYHSREDFLGDIAQIVDNSRIYNGPDDLLTQNANKLMEVVVAKFSENEEPLIRLEKAINPLLDDNDQVGLSFMFETFLNENIKPLQESWPFMKPVNKKQLKNYYERIKEPMDLETMAKKVSKHVYHSRAEFFRDMELIYNNSREFNGENSEYTLKAKKLVDITKEKLYDTYAEDMLRLEEKISEVQQRAIDQAEADSLGPSLGDMDDSSRMSEGLAMATTEAGVPGPSDEGGVAPAASGKRKRGRPRKAKLNKDYTDQANLEDDLRDSSDEDHFDDYIDEDDDDEDEDWQDVEGETEDGFSVTVEPAAPQEQQGFYQEVQGGGDAPSFQIAAPNLVIQTQAQEEVVEEEAVDENYDPMDFLQSLPGAAAPQDEQPQEKKEDEEANIVTGTFDVTAAMNAAADNNEDMVINIEMPAMEMEAAPEETLSNVQVLDIENPAAVSDTDGKSAVPDQAEVEAAPAAVEGGVDVINEDLHISDSDDDDSEPESDPTIVPPPEVVPGSAVTEQPSEPEPEPPSSEPDGKEVVESDAADTSSEVKQPDPEPEPEKSQQEQEEQKQSEPQPPQEPPSSEADGDDDGIWF